MAYLTPDDIPEDGVCRPLLIPASTDWLAFFGGALTELTKTYNWQQWGAVTVEETVAKMQEIIDGWYSGYCCELPDGSPFFRLGINGNIEQFVNGAWVEPVGDWALPAIPARTEPTEQERRCLAAANAAYALQLLYEDLADSFADTLSEVDAAVKLAVAVGGGIALLFGLITAAILQSAGFVFAGVYAAVEFITIDVWDEDFTDTLRCLLYNCSTDDGSVVHFDYVCVNENLFNATELFDITGNQQRLFFQVAVMLSWLGNEALDYAGTATAITEADCADCVECADYFDTMVGELGEKTFIGTSDPGDISALPTFPGTYGTYISSGGVNTGEGYVEGVDLPSTYNRVVLVVDLGQECTFDGASIGWYHDAFGVSTNFIMLYNGAGAYVNHNSQDSIAAIGSWVTMDWVSGSEAGVRYIQFFADTVPGTVVSLGSFQIYTSP